MTCTIMPKKIIKDKKDKVKCKAISKHLLRCKNRAMISGYCMVHYSMMKKRLKKGRKKDGVRKDNR